MVLCISLDFKKRNLNVLVIVGSISSERFNNNYSIFFLIIKSCHTSYVHPTMWKGHFISVLGHSFSKCSFIWKIKELLAPVQQQKPCKTTLQFGFPLTALIYDLQKLTILDKSNWDSNAVLIIFCKFWVPTQNSASFSKFCCSSPSLHPAQCWNSGAFQETPDDRKHWEKQRNLPCLSVCFLVHIFHRSVDICGSWLQNVSEESKTKL